MTISCNHCKREAPRGYKVPYICPCGKSGIHATDDIATAEKIEAAFVGGPAFPIPNDCDFDGMTLRDYFAAKAMQSMIAKSSGWDSTGGKDGVPLISKYSYEYADAMLAERDK